MQSHSLVKRLVFILFIISSVGCSLQTINNNMRPLKAVYFVRGQGELSAEDLQAHPEVVVVHTFDEFKQHASHQKIALWVDISAIPFYSDEEEKWINAAPQTYYPIVVIGISDTLHAFRDLLGLDGFMGPAADYPGKNAPGFSVMQWKAKDNLGFHALILNGYNQKPTVQVVLEITNALLEGKPRPTPISTFPQPIKQIPTSVSGTGQVLLIDEWPKDGFPTDAAKITTITLEKNILKINVTYQGGCQEHTFEVHAETAFLQSYESQGLLYLSHDAYGDTCTETVEKLLSFNLVPLNVERNDPRERPLLLRIYEPVGGSFATEPFMPLIEWP